MGGPQRPASGRHPLAGQQREGRVGVRFTEVRVSLAELSHQWHTEAPR